MKNQRQSLITFLCIHLMETSLFAAGEYRRSTSAPREKNPIQEQDHQPVSPKSAQPKQAKKENVRTSHSKFGVGIELGANATYGNGLKIMIDPWSMLNFQGGVGYNSTGFKAGAGAALVLPVGERLGFFFGGSGVYSAGTQGKVSLPAKFTPEGGSEEKITVTRKFRATPAAYGSPFLGVHFSLTPMFRLMAQVNYNRVFSGNKIDLSESAEYDTPIEPTNEAEVNTDFDKKAKEKLDINGPGVSAGLQFRF